MFFLRRWLLILFALILGGGQVFAAGSRESRAYAAAVGAFHDELWSRAETEFDQFIQKYPKSASASPAVLLQAQAEIKQGEFTNAIALLGRYKSAAGALADEFEYWTGEAQFQSGSFRPASETFAALVRDFPRSPLRLRALVESASARSRFGDWEQLIYQLQDPNGVFQRAVQREPTNELVANGRLLLAQAENARKDFAGGLAVLQSVDSSALAPDPRWQWASLLYQNRSAAGDLDAALAATTNLMQIAQLANDAERLAEGVALHAEALEKSGRPDDAIAAYRENLTTNAPVELQRQAVLKVAELNIAQGRLADAEVALTNFLAQFPESPAQDAALLTLGELQLKEFAAQPTATNHLSVARARLDQFLGTYTNSPLAAQAYLDRGWCQWLAGQTNESLGDFQMAAAQLPFSEELAVARFKIGDALFAQKNFSAALTNYLSVLDDFSGLPEVSRDLGERALYQNLRVCLELKDESGASNALVQILKIDPAGQVAQNGTLLFGEGLADLGSPTGARLVFDQFAASSPGSPLVPQAQIAVAHSYELEQNWPAAITRYENWLQDFPTNTQRPQVEYALAQAYFPAGRETNAFYFFTRFVAQNSTNSLAPLAQWWVADHFFRAGDFVGAETNYERIYQDWPSSDLARQSRMMAGRAAMGRLGYSDAKKYFTDLVSDTNCPADLAVQARFACGAALMHMDSADTNNPLANLQLATNLFSQIVRDYPTNDFGARAWGEIGDCDLQLGDYASATNAYAQVFDPDSAASTAAGVPLRSQAQIGFGIALEKMADLAAGGAQTDLLRLALDNYLDVFDTGMGNNLRDGETADVFWVKKAGLQALALIKSLGVGAPDKFIGQMKILFPESRAALENERATLQPGKN